MQQVTSVDRAYIIQLTDRGRGGGLDDAVSYRPVQRFKKPVFLTHHRFCTSNTKCPLTGPVKRPQVELCGVPTVRAIAIRHTVDNLWHIGWHKVVGLLWMVARVGHKVVALDGCRRDAATTSRLGGGGSQSAACGASASKTTVW